MRQISLLKNAAKILLITAVGLWLFAGCAKDTGTEAAQTPSAAPFVLATPVATTEPDATSDPGADGSSENDEDSMAVTHDGWVYYLAVNDPVVVEYNEDPPLCRKKEDGTEDMALGIRGFFFDIIGDYIYVDSNDLDVDETGVQTWGTTRMNLDGSGKKRLEYGSMSARLIPEGEQKFYFTTLGDCAIYTSDFACENVKVIVVALPDQSELSGKLGGTGNMLSLVIGGIGDGLVDFEVTVSADDGTILYSGAYKTNAAGTSTEKISGTYYEYDPSGNE